MARARRIEREPESADGDDESEFSERDFVMARLAAARNSLQAAIDAIDEAVGLYVNPDDDAKGKERAELVDTAVDAVGVASRCLEAAEEMVDEVDPQECEPWEDEDEEPPAELPRARVHRS